MDADTRPGSEILRILHVDDQESARHIVSNLLTEATRGMSIRLEVTSCPDARSGLQTARNESFDVAIIDLTLDSDGDSGHDLVQKLSQQHARLAIAVLSADPTLSAVDRAIQSGADTFLPKDQLNGHSLLVHVAAAGSLKGQHWASVLAHQMDGLPAPVSKAVEPPSGFAKILIVDDSRVDALRIAEQLQKIEGIESISSNTAEDTAALHAQLKEADIVVCDHYLPEGTSLDVLAEFHETRPGAPFVVVSGALTHSKARQLRRKGVAACVGKEQLDRLPEVVAALVQGRVIERDHVAVAPSEDLANILDTCPIPIVAVGADGKLRQGAGRNWEESWDGFWRACNKELLGLVGRAIKHGTAQEIIEYEGKKQFVSGFLAADHDDQTVFMTFMENGLDINKERVWLETLRSMTHDLANPLSVIMMQLHIIANNQTVQDEALSSRIKSIEAAARRMGLLVSTGLDMARAATDELKLRRKPVALATVADELSLTFRARCEAKSIEWSAECTSSLVWNLDPGRFNQIVFNLVDNAIKYTPNGGAVGVEMVQEADFLVLSVTDSGIGFDEDGLAELFDLYARPNEERSSEGGHGIGLHHVKRLTELHGASIDVQSPGPNKGSVFTLKFPLFDGVDA